jgi:hypothetical protein
MAMYVRYLIPQMSKGFVEPFVGNLLKVCGALIETLEAFAECLQIEEDTAVAIVASVEGLLAIVMLLSPETCYDAENGELEVIAIRNEARGQATLRGLLSGAIQDSPDGSYKTAADEILKFRPMTIKHAETVRKLLTWHSNFKFDQEELAKDAATIADLTYMIMEDFFHQRTFLFGLLILIIFY